MQHSRNHPNYLKTQMHKDDLTKFKFTPQNNQTGKKKKEKQKSHQPTTLMQSRKTGDVTMQPKGVAAETDTSQTCNKMIGFYHFNVIFTGHQIRMFTFIHYLQICSCMLAQNKSTYQLYDMRRSASSRKNIYSIHFFLTQYI